MGEGQDSGRCEEGTKANKKKRWSVLMSYLKSCQSRKVTLTQTVDLPEAQLFRKGEIPEAEAEIR